MLAPIKPETIRALAAQSLAVQQIRSQLAQVEAEVLQAKTALGDLPTWACSDILARGEEKLKKLKEREQQLVEQAERTALREAQEAYVLRLRAEAEPLLSHAAIALENARKALNEVVNLEKEARANRGSIMSESFDASSVRFFLPLLEYQPSRGTWILRRQN